MKNQVKKGDTVIVIAGSDKGKKGKVLEVARKKGKVRVEGVHIVTRHVKARSQGQKSGRIQKEAYVDISNVMSLESVDKKTTRTRDAVQQSNG
jgi:large subunit ribosomal protein L24